MFIHPSYRCMDMVGLARKGIFGPVGKQVGDAVGRSQAKAAAAAVPGATPLDASTTVSAGGTSANANRGRAALISTSPSGVQGLDPTGRRRVLGN